MDQDKNTGQKRCHSIWNKGGNQSHHHRDQWILKLRHKSHIRVDQPEGKESHQEFYDRHDVNIIFSIKLFQFFLEY